MVPNTPPTAVNPICLTDHPEISETDSSAEERLIRLLRDSDSATRTLAAWHGVAVELEIVHAEEGAPTEAERECLELDSLAIVQRREIRLKTADQTVLSEALAVVAIEILPESARIVLREGRTPLGTVLTPFHPRRHTISVRRTGGAVRFEIHARLEVAGRPLAWVHERYLSGAIR